MDGEAPSINEAGNSGIDVRVDGKTKADYGQKPNEKTVIWIVKDEKTVDAITNADGKAKEDDTQIKIMAVWVTKDGNINEGTGTDGKDPGEPGTSIPVTAIPFASDVLLNIIGIDEEIKDEGKPDQKENVL